MWISKEEYKALVDENERSKEIIHKLEEHGAIHRSEVKRVTEINDELQRHIKALNKELKEAQKNNVLNTAWSEGGSNDSDDDSLLLPCPFCGGEAHYAAAWARFGGPMVTAVVCGDCRAATLYKERQSDAKRMWNRRAVFEESGNDENNI